MKRAKRILVMDDEHYIRRLLSYIFEKKGFEKGTWKIAKAVAGSKAKTIVGGGDTIAAIREIDGGKLLEKFSFVSTGGGAMLEFLAKGTLPGIEALKQSA